MKNRVIELKDVDVEIVKIVGVIEFLENMIKFEEMSIESFKNYIVVATKEDNKEMIDIYTSCLHMANDKIRDLDSKLQVQKELLELEEMEYKDGNLYSYTDEDHEEWLMEQIDPNLNGGVL